MNSIEHSSQKIFISTLGNVSQNSTIYNTNFVVSIPPIIIQQNDPHVIIIGIESLVLPFSYKMINSQNNTLIISGITYTIPEGNYNITTLLVALNQLQPNSPKINFTYNVDTNRLSIDHSQNNYVITIDSGTTCERVLGCKIRITPYAQFEPFPSIVNLATITSVLVQIANLTTKNFDNTTGANNIISKIPISVQPNQVLNYFNNQPFFSTIADKVIQMLHIVLLTDDHKPLILDGNPDWAITIRIDYLKKESTILQPTAIQQIRRGN
jgi:hypothetical protein